MRRVLALAVALAIAAGCGGGTSPSAPAGDAPATAAGAEQALAARLTGRELSFDWVRCVDAGVRREGAPVHRCNVNFGEPHIEAYCVLVREGRAVTQVEDRTLRCRRTRTGDEP
jgi:hypothetical protein